MLIIKDKKDCCGCWACYNVCPRHCITMDADAEGFRYPTVHNTMCTDCGLCEKVCPVLHADKEDIPHWQQGYLVQHKDIAIRKDSTSGGAFTAIAQWILNQGGVVFGGGYEQGTFTVIHQFVEKEDSLNIFRNSKYVQSEIRDTFKQVLEFLKKGRWVCFSGTPCQVNGLRGFLRHREFEKLVLVDLVCRGIPSPLVLDKYIATQQKKIGGKFTRILFRDKHYSYQYSTFSIYNKEPEKNYHKGVDTNAYLRAFFNNLSDRPSCYDCKVKMRYRHSDLTIWDCFPVERFTKDFDQEGTTRVLAQSIKGKMIMESIQNYARIAEVPADMLVEGVREMYYSIPMNPKRTQFFNDLNNMRGADFFQKWFPTTFKVRCNAWVRLFCYKIGIYTFAKRIFMTVYTRRDDRTVTVR